jgi:hypothetical protein
MGKYLSRQSNAYRAIVFPEARNPRSTCVTRACRFSLQIAATSSNLKPMREDRIPLSHILPVVDLALLVLLVIVPITLTSVHLYEASKGATQIHIHSGQFDMTLPRDQIVPWAIRMVTVAKAHMIQGLNVPGTAFEILISLPTSWPVIWHPAALLPETWDALVFPFFCLPFWWLVGCGLDGLISKERLHWSLLLIGTLLAGGCLALVLGFHAGISVAEREANPWLMRGLTGWTTAFAVLPIAWIIQSMRQHRNPPESPEASL